jgi:hypothetical protein
MKNSHIVIIGIIAAGIGFWGGMKYEQSSAAATVAAQPTSGMGRGAGRGQGGQRGGVGGGFISGQVVSKDATSITVQMRDGSSKIILITAATKYSKMAEGLLGDILVGKQISVMGDANADGSVTAQSVQLRPDMMTTSTPAK